MDMKVKKIEVKGDKVIAIDSKVNEEGFFTDKFGNKIYKTDSEANKQRLA